MSGLPAQLPWKHFVRVLRDLGIGPSSRIGDHRGTSLVLPEALPALMHRKLARCQWTSGRICLIRQTNSAGSRSQ